MGPTLPNLKCSFIYYCAESKERMYQRSFLKISRKKRLTRRTWTHYVCPSSGLGAACTWELYVPFVFRRGWCQSSAECSRKQLQWNCCVKPRYCFIVLYISRISTPNTPRSVPVRHTEDFVRSVRGKVYSVFCVLRGSSSWFLLGLWENVQLTHIFMVLSFSYIRGRSYLWVLMSH